MSHLKKGKENENQNLSHHRINQIFKVLIKLTLIESQIPLENQLDGGESTHVPIVRNYNKI
jgi:hypothetical protein